MNSADQLLYNASLLVEEGDAEGAMSELAEAISLASTAQMHLQLLRARLFLGELLLQLAREEEALDELHAVIELSSQFADDPSLVVEEVDAAREHLAGLMGT